MSNNLMFCPTEDYSIFILYSFKLLYTGMLETTKIRREGFAIRPSFEEFVDRLVTRVCFIISPFVLHSFFAQSGISFDIVFVCLFVFLLNQLT